MSSTFIPKPNRFWTRGINGQENVTHSFIQFVPGVVVKVVTGSDSTDFAGKNEKINSIIAMPHYTNTGINKNSTLGEEFRYYQLLRGIQDTPVPGDPVLLCDFGGVQYFLGPLNSEGSPNFNKDKFETDESTSGYEVGIKSSLNDSTPLFIRQDQASRLEKRLNIKLDDPIGYENQTPASNGTIHGDLVLEGRHGNSLRIGSRNINPYLIISNGREVSNNYETSLDGSIFTMFKYGSIRDHFYDDWKDTGNEFIKYDFTLADEEIYPGNDGKGNPLRSIRESYSHYLGRGGVSEKEKSFDVEEAIYNYQKDQIFTSSDRITFNARKDSIFLSAFNHIHIGCGSSMTLSTSKNILVRAAESFIIKDTPFVHIDSPGAVIIDGRLNVDDAGNSQPSIFLGNPDKGDMMDNAVLGNGLVVALSMIINEIQSLALLTAEAVEGNKSVGESVELMRGVEQALYDILGGDSLDPAYGLKQTILSNSVEIKK